MPFIVGIRNEVSAGELRSKHFACLLGLDMVDSE